MWAGLGYRDQGWCLFWWGLEALAEAAPSRWDCLALPRRGRAMGSAAEIRGGDLIPLLLSPDPPARESPSLYKGRLVGDAARVPRRGTPPQEQVPSRGGERGAAYFAVSKSHWTEWGLLSSRRWVYLDVGSKQTLGLHRHRVYLDVGSTKTLVLRLSCRVYLEIGT